MHYSKESFYTIILFIHIKIFTNQAESCDKFSSRVNPEILCNGFANLLSLRNFSDETVNKLSISKNYITAINSSSFKEPLNSITDLYLDNNLITNISANAFNNLPNLQVIDLSNNKIEILSFKAFNSNKGLITIDLSGNKINILDINGLNELPQLTSIALSGNPLNVCDQKTSEVLKYLESRKVNTFFLKTCENNIIETDAVNITIKKIDVEDDNTVSSTISKGIKENFILLMVLLLVMIILAFGLGYLIAYLCIILFNKIKKFRNNSNSRQRTISGHHLISSNQRRFSQISGVDEDGYEKPIVIQNPPRYLTVLPDEAPLILLNSQEDIRTSRIQVELPIPHISKSVVNSSTDTYQPNHVYEEIPVKHFYSRNLKDHLMQPYSHVTIVPAK